MAAPPAVLPIASDVETASTAPYRWKKSSVLAVYRSQVGVTLSSVVHWREAHRGESECGREKERDRTKTVAE